MKKNKFLPLLASIALFSGPAILVAACTTEISRYQADLSNDLQDRILFDFVGVNYSVSAKSQFSSAFKQGMDFIKKEVEGIMAQQEFYNFFREKLNYSEADANAAFTRIKDNLGLNLLAADYFNTVNSGQSFDRKVYTNKLIFQTNNWHQMGTTKFDYSKSPFYSQDSPDGNPDLVNNPDEVFTSTHLYSDENLANPKIDEQIQRIAKHADENYNKELNYLTNGNPIWDNPGPEEQLPPTLENNNVVKYQKSLERFKWWLRFRYQQYYYSQILPQLNETLFTMANILNSILKINNNSNSATIQIDNTKYAAQLQNWGPNSVWNSNYKLVWDYTTSISNAQNLESAWTSATPSLPELITGGTSASDPLTLNPLFLTRLAGSDQKIKNTVDPILGLNAYVSDTSSKDYNGAVTNTDDKSNNKISGWRINTNDDTHYWSKNNRGSFAYSAPIYWIDVVQNLDFNYYSSTDESLTINKDEDYGSFIQYWNIGENSKISSSNFSKYMRGPDVTATNPDADPNYEYYQNMKWNTFWQMIYFLASQAETNPNKEVAATNFTLAAKVLYPKFIRKENIYNIDFWNAVKEYY
ncbi:hypothetical protein [Spiroplasma platyhelix]|uniref:Lipoprotein n=1 Tax=Spiroplasma platyhelix PALS-1 TaxID=1276218 RepID=A0A846U073_9MOLU|nr:hypothetical protein [Spiroplasma platyhelix]MBE4704054.1 hypothetical protein [Spiroplasma platyhelix PALS-1]NKE38424.1 hypothetical protein [Spiroplasma platyhelix PALS-1]UJB29312.1 hypothetical protein SPLAT_v1c05480 [Spiroplasma platyhelix PALS-1]